MAKPSPKPAPEHTPRHVLLRPLWMRSFRRKHRWMVRLILLLPALAVIGGILLTQTAITRSIIMDRLSRALNVDATAEGTRLRLNGDLVIDRLKLRAPGVQGPAGQFLSITRAVADVDWWSTIRGNVRIRGLRLVEPVATVSQSMDDQKLNIEALTLPQGSAGGTEILPRVTLQRAAIELGEHDAAGAYSLLRHVTMDGDLTPLPGKPGEYDFKLREANARPRRTAGAAAGEAGAGFKVRGSIADGRVEVKIEDFSLDDWPATSVPKSARQIFQDLDLQGSVPLASFLWTRQDGTRAELALSDVAMYLPLGSDRHIPERPELEPQGPPTQLMRMHGVSGAIVFAHERVTAKVDGLVEDLPYHVEVQYEGRDENSPFRVDFESRDFRVERNPDLLPYAPQKVREWLQVFSSPTATVSTSVTVRRLPPVGDQPGPIRVNGEVELKQGTAAYSKFPYEFRDLQGKFSFDNDTVRVVKVTGKSASGAELLADGIISPLDDSAEVMINVDVKHARIDDAMEAAFGPGRGEVISSLFNQKRYDELLAANLIQPRAQAEVASNDLEAAKKELAAGRGDAEPLKARIGRLESRLRIPAFDFRGAADVSVKVHSPRGRGVEYETYIDIMLPSVGMIPEKFPLPIEARNVHVIVDNGKGRLVSGQYSTAGGGSAQVDATFTVPGRNETSVRPMIDMTVADVPLDALLIHALPGDEPSPGARGGSVKRMLRELVLRGKGGGKVTIAPRGADAAAPLGFDGDFTISGCSATPAPRPGAGVLRIAGIGGSLKVSESALHAEFRGTPALPGRPPKPVSTGPLTASIDATFGEGQAPSDYKAAIACPGLSLAAPIESVVGVFSPEAAERLASIRKDHSPQGVVDVLAQVRTAAGEPAVRVELGSATDLSFDVLGQRASLGKTSGALAILAASGGPTTLESAGFSVPISFAGEPAGELRMDGQYVLSGAQAGDPEGEGLRVGLRGGRFESALVRRLLPEALGTEMAADYEVYKPQGLFDLEATVLAPSEPGGPPNLRGRLEPHSLLVQTGGETINLEQMGGSIEFEPGFGQVRQLTGRAQDWSFRFSGLWDRSDDGTVTLRSQITGSASRLCPDLRAALPAELRSVLDSMELHINGPLSLDDGELTLTRGPGTEDDRTNFTGTVALSKADLNAGVALTDLSGRIQAAFARAGGDTPPEFRLDVDADALKISGVSVTGARTTVKSGDAPGRVIIEEATGECYGGRMVVGGSVVPDRTLPGAPRRFEVQGRISGVRFNPFLEELSSQFKADAAKADAPRPPADDPGAEDNSRGMLDAEFTLAGVVGQNQTRRGRGSMRVSGGRVLTFPFMTRLIEVSNLALPGNARLDFATGDFFIDGGLVTFSDLAVRSKTVQILGSGTMTWPGQILDLRFNTWASRPIPVLSALVRNIRDELVNITVRGKLGEQEVRLQQFPGPRRMLGRASGPSESDQSRHVTDLYERTRAGQSIHPSSGNGPARPDGQR